MKEVNKYVYYGNFNSLNKWVHFYHSGNYIVFWGIKKICKKTNTTSYYNSIYILTMTGIGKLKAFEPTLVLVPFRDMISGPIDTILNIILFVPLGFFLPLLYKKYGHIGSVALVSFLLSLSIEIVQMFGRGATDINDLITNTVGACLGFFIYQLLSKLVSKELCRKFQSYNINEGTELLFFIIYSFVIMVTIQPIIISTLFHLA